MSSNWEDRHQGLIASEEARLERIAKVHCQCGGLQDHERPCGPCRDMAEESQATGPRAKASADGSTLNGDAHSATSPPRLVDVRCRACAEPVSCPRGHQDGLMDIGETPTDDALPCVQIREELESRGILWCSCGFQATAHASEFDTPGSEPAEPVSEPTKEQLNAAESTISDWSIQGPENMKAAAPLLDYLRKLREAESVSEKEVQEWERSARNVVANTNPKQSATGAERLTWAQRDLRLITELRRTIGRSEYNRKQIHAVRVNCEAESKQLRFHIVELEDSIQADLTVASEQIATITKERDHYTAEAEKLALNLREANAEVERLKAVNNNG